MIKPKRIYSTYCLIGLIWVERFGCRFAKKNYFCPVFGFSTKNVLVIHSVIFFQDVKQKSKHRLVFTPLYSFGVEVCLKLTILWPFYVKFIWIYCNYLKMSGFSSKNVRYPRYQDTKFLLL